MMETRRSSRPVHTRGPQAQPGPGARRVALDRGFCDILIASNKAGKYPQYISVNSRDRNLVGDGSDGAGCIAADPF